MDFVILLNDNTVDDNDMVSSAHVNYMSVIHAVHTNVSHMSCRDSVVRHDSGEKRRSADDLSDMSSVQGGQPGVRRASRVLLLSVRPLLLNSL